MNTTPGGQAFLHDSLRLLTDAHHAYAHSDDGNRRLANQAFYDRLEITDDEQLRPRLAEPFKTIVSEAREGKEAKREHSTSADVACSRKTLWVELTGLEPVTPCLQSRCATNCAIAPGMSAGLLLGVLPKIIPQLFFFNFPPGKKADGGGGDEQEKCSYKLHGASVR